jgi:hypothetical protein
MTSIMHPALAASRFADQAIQSLTSVNDVLLGNEIRPMHEPFPGTTGSTFSRAAVHGDQALAFIDSALSMGINGSHGLISDDVIKAFDSARTQAQEGVTMLRAKTLMPVDPNRLALKFDGAKLWLDIAKSYIALDLRRPTNPVVPQPPVTILPVEVEAPEAMAR